MDPSASRDRCRARAARGPQRIALGELLGNLSGEVAIDALRAHRAGELLEPQ
jgi:hypothetical protein